MELIKEIYETQTNSNDKDEELYYKFRKAARTVLFNAQGEIALLFVSENSYHKLPGGGIELGEGIQSALKREVMEEVGAKINILGDIGVIIEYRNEHKLIQLSYCFYSNIIGEPNTPSFTEEEISNGFKLKWLNINDAVLIMERDEPSNYVGRFIKERDLAFLKKLLDLKPEIKLNRRIVL